MQGYGHHHHHHNMLQPSFMPPMNVPQQYMGHHHMMHPQVPFEQRRIRHPSAPVQQQQQQQQQQQPMAANTAQRAPAPRNNEIGEPSTVLHLRNVTPEVSQLSIQNVVQSFGRIRNIVMLRQKNQALVELESLQSATQLVDFFREPGYAEIDGRRVYIRYSLHSELTASQRMSKTLLVSMFNTQYDVSAAAQITPTIVYQIFGSYGTVEKIVVLPKNESSIHNHNRVQALVQFDQKESADRVKNMLQGQPVTLGDTVTFTLDIQFSRMDEIKTSSPHNSLVIPKSGSTQPPVPQASTFSAQDAHGPSVWN